MANTEYRNLTIPLAIRITPAQTRFYEGRLHPAAAVVADPIIRRHVAEARRDGWEPDMPTSYLMLATHDRVRFNAKYGAISAEWKYTEVVSVTVPLRRVLR